MLDRHPALCYYNLEPQRGVPSYRGVEQMVARRAHNPEVAGSSPVPATTKTRSEKTGSFLVWRCSKNAEVFAALFDAAYNILLYIDKKDRRSHLKKRGPAGLFLRANHCLCGTFFDISVRDLSVFCPGKRGLCCFPLTRQPVFFARKPPQNLPEGREDARHNVT